MYQINIKSEINNSVETAGFYCVITFQFQKNSNEQSTKFADNRTFIIFAVHYDPTALFYLIK
jgi:hypothetical protein